MDPLDEEDALVEEILSDALSEFHGVVPDAVIKAIRDNIADTLSATASGRQLLRAMKPDPDVQQSADVATVADAGGVAADSPAASAGASGVGGQARKRNG